MKKNRFILEHRAVGYRILCEGSPWKNFSRNIIGLGLKYYGHVRWNSLRPHIKVHSLKNVWKFLGGRFFSGRTYLAISLFLSVKKCATETDKYVTFQWMNFALVINFLWGRIQRRRIWHTSILNFVEKHIFHIFNNLNGQYYS